MIFHLVKRNSEWNGDEPFSHFIKCSNKPPTWKQDIAQSCCRIKNYKFQICSWHPPFPFRKKNNHFPHLPTNNPPYDTPTVTPCFSDSPWKLPNPWKRIAPNRDHARHGLVWLLNLLGLTPFELPQSVNTIIGTRCDLLHTEVIRGGRRRRRVWCLLALNASEQISTARSNLCFLFSKSTKTLDTRASHQPSSVVRRWTEESHHNAAVINCL